MSEVKRISVFIHGPNKSVDMVEASHFDRVIAERDAAIEDRDAWKGTAETFEDFYRKTEVERDAALGRESRAKEGLAEHWKVVCVQRAKIEALQQRLTAADERADVAASLIQRYVANFDTEIECYEDIQPNDLEHDQVLTDMRGFLAALKPSEGGSDEYRKSCEVAHKALSLENQRITPARFKCLACGEYHEGSGNLPCPSMSPYSRIEP